MTGVTERLTDYLTLVRADNPGPMTLEGTNTWVVGDVTAGPPAVVDPGPLIEDHLQAILNACHHRIAVILLTHRHLDHAESAATLAERAGCAVRAVDPRWQVGPAGLPDGSEIEVPDGRLKVVATPGHTSDSCSLLLTEDDGPARLLTGDTVLGRGTTVIAEPDGDLRQYLASLDTLEQLVADRQVRELLPGHGPVVTEPAEWLAFYHRHRRQRLEQVRAALAAGDRDAPAIVARVYADTDPRAWPAAEQSVRAQLRYLQSAD
jgi:glyoxylase-like metal-dependent hydrolase (beta-lactamase superfamily II)